MPVAAALTRQDLDLSQKVFTTVNVARGTQRKGCDVSYREWIELIAAAILIGCAITAAEASIIWCFIGPL